MVSSENSRIFMWKAFREWKSVLEDMFGDILNAGLEDKVRQNRTSVEYCDDSEAFEGLSGYSIDSMITTEKINEFRQRYSHIRVYHACRPIDVKSYYDKGILPLCKEVQVEHFRSIFLSGDFPELTEKMLQQSIKESAPYSVGSEGELCLAIDDRLIIDRCGHYLIYGSEYIGCLVTRLPIEDTPKYRSALRKIGKPTFLEINLPNTTEYVSDSVIWVVINRMIKEWTYCIAHSKTESCLFDCTISFREPLLPKHICSYYHPSKIPDPIMRHKIYDAETGEYEIMAQ